MSHFYGVVQGNRGDAHRGGSKSSGMNTTCASWDGCVVAFASHDEKKGYDEISFGFNQWRGRGFSYTVYDGAIDPSNDHAAVLSMVQRAASMYLDLKGADEKVKEKVCAKVSELLLKQALLEAL